MTLRALEHAYPKWVNDADDDPTEPREVWIGKMRIVRNRARAKLLRRRGVPMWTIIAQGNKPKYWCWFETNESYEYRKFAKLLLKHYGLRRLPAVPATHFQCSIASAYVAPKL